MHYHFSILNTSKSPYQSRRWLIIILEIFLEIFLVYNWQILPSKAATEKPVPCLDLDAAWLLKAMCKPAKPLERKNPAAKISPVSPLVKLHPKHKTQPLSKITSPDLREPIDQLEETVRLDVQPNSNQPISNKDAIALQQELVDLIGRVESAYLTAAVFAGDSDTNNSQKADKLADGSKLVAATVNTEVSNVRQTLTRAKEVAKNIPLLWQRKNYALLRQQWLKAKADLWQQFPINEQLAPTEIRSVWLDRGTIVKAGNESNLAQIFDRLAAAGINTIFFETLNASYPIYPSQVAPKQNPLIKNWDPLESAVKLAHERGMELHAWVWTFAAANQRHNKILNLAPDYPGPVIEAHPEWANYDNAGNMIPVGQTKAFFDPSNPELRQYLLNLFAEIVTRYQVDGLQLDYIRYPFQDPALGRVYGYGKAAREQFQLQFGVDPLEITVDQHDLWRKWTAFRTYQVDSFVTQVSKMLREKRKDLILSVAVFPLPEAERIEKIQQHWEFWARNGDIDLIIPMTYALDTHRFGRLAQPWINSTQLGSTLLVPGIRLLSLPELGVFDQLQLVRDSPAIGYSLFAVANLNPQLDQLLNHTQGNYQKSNFNANNQPIPQRQPFDTALNRFITLQKSWQLVQENGQLQMTETKFAEFNHQAKELQNVLTQVAATPSRSNLVLARDVLRQFQSKFTTWMLAEAKENPHQVKVWENHLITIERLLRYGERRIILGGVSSQQSPNQF